MKKTSGLHREKVDSEHLANLLRETHDPDLMTALEEFGRMLLTDAQSHTASVEGKALSAAGWASALLGLLLLSSPIVPPANANALTALIVLAFQAAVIVAALLALAAAAKAIWLTDWNVPSQKDWLQESLFRDALQLRRFHLVSMLETYQDACAANDRKSIAATVAQRALLIAGGLTGVGLVLRAFSGLPDAIRSACG
jgi:hypothetical protein